MLDNPKDHENLRKNVEIEFKKNQYEKYKLKALEYVNNKEKAKVLLKDAMNKSKNVTNKGPLGEIWDKVQLLFSLLRDWISGTYKEIPLNSITMVIIGLIYFVVPLDIIPDWIPGIGVIDDAFILGLVIKQIANDLEDYEIWKKLLNKNKNTREE